MNVEQLKKTLFVGIWTTALMLVFEILFSVPAVSEGIKGWVAGQDYTVVYIAVWLMMLAQCTFIPIPAVIVFTASIGAGILDTSLGLSIFLDGRVWIFSLVTITAYMVGATISYWIGRKWGKKAVKWCAGSEEEYDKWVKFFNKDTSKWVYAATVLFPIFPDDLLCIVAGSVKFNFRFWFVCNCICRYIGIPFTIAALVLLGIGGGGPLAIIAWCLALMAEIIGYLLLKYNKTVQNWKWLNN